MCRTINLIHRKKSKLDLTNNQIADKMRGAGINITGDMVQKYFAGTAGVPIDNNGEFLRALGLKVVDSNAPDISMQEYEALKLFTGNYLNGNEQNAD